MSRSKILSFLEREIDNAMKVPGIEEIVKTFEATRRRFAHLGVDAAQRAGLLAVFETHVKGMLAEAWLQCITKIDGSFTAFDERDARKRTGTG